MMSTKIKFNSTDIGLIPEDWTVKELQDVTLYITDGKHGDCENKSDSGYYFLSVKDVIDGKLDYSEARQIMKEDFIETVNFLEKNSNYIDLISVSTFGLHKGTKIFDNPQQFGITKINEEARTVLDPKITYSVKGLSLEEVKKLKKKYSKVINKVNKFPKTINFFREHMFFID